MIESTAQKPKAKLYQKPNKSQFQRSAGCENFCRSHDICLTSLFDICIALRSFGRIVLANDTSLQSLSRELNIQCINNDFHCEQIQKRPMLTKKEAQSFASIEEGKSLARNNSGKIT